MTSLALPAINLTMTSTYCHIQEKWVPTQFSILFGKTEKHYAMHFSTLFKHMNHDSFEDFQARFMGMVCDFSEGERSGFITGMKQRFPEMDVDNCEYVTQKTYAFCEIHFYRSECRVRQNNAVVPVQRKSEFKNAVRSLLTETDIKQFDETVAYLKKQFPHCKKWLDWYLHPKRAKHIF